MDAYFYRAEITKYQRMIQEVKELKLPKKAENEKLWYHRFELRYCHDELKKRLKK